jgi:hypothetical protein
MRQPALAIFLGSLGRAQERSRRIFPSSVCALALLPAREAKNAHRLSFSLSSARRFVFGFFARYARLFRVILRALADCACRRWVRFRLPTPAAQRPRQERFPLSCTACHLIQVSGSSSGVRCEGFGFGAARRFSVRRFFVVPVDLLCAPSVWSCRPIQFLLVVSLARVRGSCLAPIPVSARRTRDGLRFSSGVEASEVAKGSFFLSPSSCGQLQQFLGP